MPPVPSIRGDAGDLLQQACSELRRRLQDGHPCRAETFLEAFPSLASDPQQALDLVVTEFVVRQELGQNPDPAEWYRRFPQWHRELERQFEVLAGLASTGQTTAIEHPLTPPEFGSDPGIGVDGPVPVLGGHQVVREIGHGGMGVVFEARDLVLGRPVALKVIRSGVLAGRQEVARFYREARAAARLSHPNIVPIHGMGLYEGQHCFTMPLLAGSLAERLPHYQDDPRAAALLVEKVARAVHHAHGQGVVHRDLKPGNILLDEQGEPHVADFGLAKLADGSPELTHSGQMLGTPAYMAPEQAAGQAGQATATSDVWAVGVILYELITGQPPFQGRTSSEVSQQVRSAQPPRPRSLCKGLPQELETIVLKCLEKEPARRYGSARELADDLAAWLCGEPIKARPLSWPRRVLRKARRHPLLSVAGLLVAMIAVALPTFLDLTNPDRPVERIEARLARSEPVTLIGERGQPQWWRWRLTTGVMDSSTDPDKAFTISSVETSFLELVRDPQGSYAFSADVRHDSSGPGSLVGLGFGYSEHNASNGVPVRCLCTLGYNDVEDPYLDSNLKKCRRAFVSVHALEPHAGNEVQLRQKSYPPRRSGAGSDFRQLRIEFTPGQVRCFWDGRLLDDQEPGRPLEHEDILTAFGGFRRMIDGKVIKPFEQIRPPFSSRGPLGLFVRGGKASFRNVSIEPLR